MNILGISCYFHDAAAALLRDGRLVAAVEEERFTRKKHDYEFPAHAIDYCLREGLSRFEPGAQGEHKLARGFLPTIVRSRHWIAHETFRDALRGWCAQEADSVRAYARTLAAHSPFKAATGAPPGDAPSSTT